MEKREISKAINILEEVSDILSDLELHELTQLPHSTIEWNADRKNLNFKDNEVMEALTKCYEAMINPQSIINALENLTNGVR